MQNNDIQKLSHILPEIKNQTFVNTHGNKFNYDNKPSTSKQEQRANKNINYASQSRQVKLDDVGGVNTKQIQKLQINNFKESQFNEEITELMQNQLINDQKAARNIERHFKKPQQPNQSKIRNLSENSIASKMGIPLQSGILNTSHNMQQQTNPDINVDKFRSTLQDYHKKDDKMKQKQKEQRTFNTQNNSSKAVTIQQNTQQIDQQLQQQQQQIVVKIQRDFIHKRQKIRGPKGLNIKVVEMWINDTVCEAESEITTSNQQKNNDKTQSKGNSPQRKLQDSKDILKSFALDRKSLGHKGVSKENIDRIYRSLFVYSFGFYEMIQDIFQHVNESAKIIANVWKIYGILLEYCSRTDFVNTVTQLEKEKTAIVDNLEDQITQKQQQFDELEVIEKEKRDILEQQILSLKQEKQNILSEKCQLEEDFKQADTAFNEEVSLRLQFEHKINELHSIHRELLMKHNRLIDEYDSLKVEHQIMKTDQDNNVRLIHSLKMLEQKLKDECRDQQRRINEQAVQFDKLKERVTQTEAELSYKNKGADKCEGLLNEEQRINEDLRFQVKNLKEKLELQTKNEEVYKRRIDELKGEQIYFNTKIDDQSERFEKQQSNIYELEKQIIDQRQNAQLQFETHSSLKMQSEQLENEIIELKNELLTTDLEALQKLIKDMKVGRIELEEEYIKCKLRLNNSLDTILAKNDLCKDLEVKMEIYEQNHLKLTVEFQTYQNIATKEQDNLKQKISKLERETKSKLHEIDLEKKQSEYVNQKLQLCNEQIENLRKETLELTSQQREDKFIMNNQSNNINQLQNVIEAEKSRSQDLLKQVTYLTTVNESTQREAKSQKVIIREMQDNHATTIEQLELQHQKQLERYVSVEYKVHSMVYEDLYTKFYDLQEDNVSLKFELEENQKSLKEKNQKLNEIFAQYNETHQDLLKTQKMLSQLKKYSVQFLKKFLESDNKNSELVSNLTELRSQIQKNEKQYKSDRENIIKLNEQSEQKLKLEIKQYEQDKEEIKQISNQKSDQIRQLQEQINLIEQIKNAQQAQLMQGMQYTQMIQQQIQNQNIPPNTSITFQQIVKAGQHDQTQRKSIEGFQSKQLIQNYTNNQNSQRNSIDRNIIKNQIIDSQSTPEIIQQVQANQQQVGYKQFTINTQQQKGYQQEMGNQQITGYQGTLNQQMIYNQQGFGNIPLTEQQIEIGRVQQQDLYRKELNKTEDLSKKSSLNSIIVII